MSLSLPYYESDQLIALIGNKRSIVHQLKILFESLIKPLRKATFLDPFCGTGSVSRIAKQLGMQLFASDIEYFSYVINSVYLKLSAVELSDMFNKVGGVDSFYSLLNYHGLYAAQTANGIKEPYISRYYSQLDEKDDVGRLFFTAANARFFDAVREELESTFIEQRIDEVEKNVVLSSLLYELTRKANTSGTFTSYHKSLKNVRSRISEIAQLTVPTLYDGQQLPTVVENMDALTFLKQYSGDICYLDPPASVVQYGSAYHLLNTVALWDNYRPSGELDQNGNFVDKAGIRDDWKKSHSPFCSLKAADKAFVQLFGSIDARHIVLTYPSNGLVEAKRIVELLSARHQPVSIIPLYRPNLGGIQGKKGKNNLINVYVTGKIKNPSQVVQTSLEMLPTFKKLDNLSTKVFKKMANVGPFRFIGKVILETPLQINEILTYQTKELNKIVSKLESNVVEDPQEAFKLLLRAIKKDIDNPKDKLKIERKLAALAKLLSEDQLKVYKQDEIGKKVLEQLGPIGYDS